MPTTVYCCVDEKYGGLTCMFDTEEEAWKYAEYSARVRERPMIVQPWRTIPFASSQYEEKIYWAGHEAGVKFARENPGFTGRYNSQTIYRNWEKS